MSIMAIFLFRWKVQKLKELLVDPANFNFFEIQDGRQMGGNLKIALTDVILKGKIGIKLFSVS